MRICQYESHDFRRRPGHPVAPLDGPHAQGPRSRSRKAHAGTGDTAVEGSRIQRDNGQYPPLRGADYRLPPCPRQLRHGDSHQRRTRHAARHRRRHQKGTPLSGRTRTFSGAQRGYSDGY